MSEVYIVRKNRSRNERVSPFIVFIVLYCILASAEASMTLGINYWIEFGAAVVCFFSFLSKHAIIPTTKSLIATGLFMLSSIYYLHGESISGYISRVMLVSLALVLLNTKDDWRIELFHRISKWYAILVVIAIVGWILHIVLPLPHTTTYIEYNNMDMYVDNYFFFSEMDYVAYRADNILRFQGMFLEPGHMGTITAFFLIANQFNLQKKENWIFLIGALLTVSASTYLLIAIGYMFYMCAQGKGRKVVWTVLGIISIVAFFVFYNDGDNIINDLILGKFTREQGAVESRTSLEVLLMVENMLSTGTDLWFGKGVNVDIEYGGAGFFLFFLYCGILGTILLVLAYLSIYLSCKSRFGFYLFLIYIVSFLQRTYPYWDAFSLPFILGLPFILSEERRMRINKLIEYESSLFIK